jgi:hypothetical protein
MKGRPDTARPIRNRTLNAWATDFMVGYSFTFGGLPRLAYLFARQRSQYNTPNTPNAPIGPNTRDTPIGWAGLTPLTGWKPPGEGANHGLYRLAAYLASVSTYHESLSLWQVPLVRQPG